MRTLLFRSLKSSKISFHLFEDEFHNDFNFHKPTILDLKPLSLKCLSGSLIKHGIRTDCGIVVNVDQSESESRLRRSPTVWRQGRARRHRGRE